jgi:hypothetical protein
MQPTNMDDFDARIALTSLWGDRVLLAWSSPYFPYTLPHVTIPNSAQVSPSFHLISYS